MRRYYGNSIEAINDSVLSMKFMDKDIETNLKHISEQINAACARSGRHASDIRVLLATKTVSAERLQNVLQKNYTLFGENTAQELVKKQSELKNQDIEWHFIGRLQSNKVKDVLPHCRLIHSLDRMSLAQEIQKRATQTVNVLVEVHSGTEDSKAGISPEELPEFAQQLLPFDKICIQGVMTIADNATNTEAVRNCFRRTKESFEKLKTLSLKNCDLKYISMGMSNDFELAIEEGANIIRLGSAVFGKRTLPQK
ncbi:MAG: YggS family pyridoxal phosphate-dependent enzyme [Bdellovibrionaceae bacterium]|nr:YggS family pyridoxal phosphate-dependent enzyme [Pseudobdellovibrionaceae bacterium]